MFEPTNEKELKETEEFIFRAPVMVEQNLETLKEVYRHYTMLEEFSYKYKETDIEAYWYMKIWPLRIFACITDGK